ncbi:response regulator transcription factor [Marinithermus hydrothermalis]|uniref:Two component transcriptional regulator, winged helix family n=1 Tax=Marinithermus hydrothermalis (strain DSM 14884 / JCM 11576 / T1) TaxID=869210 RepID=F2NNH2_MARHT|nr:response regulator transcription factor [Marinithermus hydrothermalis]AEB10782.1 two component transcriptional regulator, winged helix family [Marinithermus hydrothermalis DSM 14884]
MEPALILIVEDEPRLAEVLERYLRREGFRTERATDGRRALELWRATRPDLILLDLMVPGPDGLEITRTLRKTSDVPIIMVTARAEETDRLVGLELGADDYVTKPFSPREVVARVKAVLRRAKGRVRAPERYTVGRLEVDLEAFEARCAGQPLPLSPAQLRLLAALAREAGRAVPRAELLAQLGDGDADARTVDAHVKNLRRRLGPCGAQIETVRGVGYRLRP